MFKDKSGGKPSTVMHSLTQQRRKKSLSHEVANPKRFETLQLIISSVKAELSRRWAPAKSPTQSALRPPCEGVRDLAAGREQRLGFLYFSLQSVPAIQSTGARPCALAAPLALGICIPINATPHDITRVQVLVRKERSDVRPGENSCGTATRTKK